MRLLQLVLRVLSIAVFAIGVPVAWFGMAEADAPAQAGWWFKLNSTPSPLDVPAPPNVPEGGLYIANDPSGPAAIAAVNLPAEEGATGTLTLKVADGGAGEALVVACPTVGLWTPAEGGKWDAAPKYDCDAAKVLGTVAEDESTITFAI